MQYRKLKKKELNVSALGMGPWAIGGDAWGPVVDDADSLVATIQLDQTFNLFVLYLRNGHLVNQ